MHVSLTCHLIVDGVLIVIIAFWGRCCNRETSCYGFYYDQKYPIAT